MAAVTLLAVIAVAAFAGYRVGASVQAPADDSADAGFSRDMQTHHNQAVELSLIVRDRTADPAVRSVAYDIATSQAQQSGQMYGWLSVWGLAQTSSTTSMAWMRGDHHAMANAQSMGLATPAQIQALRRASGPEAERQFLTLMIAHHRGGVAMAQAALDLARRPEVHALAGAIHTSQQSEIVQLQTLLTQRQ
ncbi:DUF305 domain-containing protein [Humibacillus sp. DSM 29435]|uniref:DUF305 domain-containing protein n=1 Tax=Humibacillus sp. DSM 29435 TaxID=1869167 RepID=UPI0020C81950|nr:DUF305 domain-containing protein [Humibacillus sp. DSM 29435]